MPLPPDLASHIKQLVGSERYLDSASETASYGFNSYPMHTEPAAVVLFEERAHVERVVPMLYERGVPMVIRGSGTNVKTIQDLALGNGLMFPPNPGNSEAITIGGAIGCNSSGDLALGYGSTRDFVVGLDIVTGEGRVDRKSTRLNSSHHSISY